MANETNYLMSDDSYNASSTVFHSSDGYKTYVPKKWGSNEMIERIEMNNIEQGIQIALEQYDTIEQLASEGKAEMVSYYTNTILPSINGINETINTFTSTFDDNVAASVAAHEASNNASILALLRAALGADYYNITALDWTLPNGSQSVNTRITELYSAVFGNGGNNNISQLQTDLTSLDTYVRGASNSSSLAAQVTALQNELGGGGSGTSFKEKIEAAIGRPLEPTAAQITADSNLNSDLLTLIENLQGVLGLSSSAAGELSLIEKIEGALGRSLTADTANGETIDQNTGEYSNSIMIAINQIKGVLGIDGGISSGSSSSLVSDVDTALNLLYGYTVTTTTEENTEDPENPIVTHTITRNLAPNLNNLNIQNSYPTLYNDFYLNNAGSIPVRLSAVETAQSETRTLVNSLSSTVSGYNNTITDLSEAYRDADIRTYGDNAYLILKYDLTETDAEDVEDMVNKNNKYLQLPLMGGGGGAAYELDAAIIDRVLPVNNTLTIGDDYNISFTWAVTQDNSNISLDGTLIIKLNGTAVDTQFIMSNTPYTYNLGQYINTSGRNVFTITISNAAVPTRTLYTTIVAYNAVLESTFNPDIVQTNSTINYTYTASIGSGSIEKVLHISIDGTPLTLTGNTSLIESARTISFSTPAEGDHLMEVWFTANVGTVANPINISSNKLTYGILCGTSLNTRIVTNFTQTTIEQYNTLTINYLVVTPNQETTRVEFYFGSSVTPIVENVTATYQRIDYPVTQAGGTLTIRIVAGNAEKILQVEVITNTTYDFSYVDSQLQVYFTPEQKTNASSDKDVWVNSVTTPEASYANISAQMENFLFYNTNNFDGWLRDNNGQNFLRLRNKDKVTINLPIFNFNIDANNKITDGMTFEIDFKTSDVTNYGTEIIACYEEGLRNVENAKTLIFTAQDATLNNSVALQTQFKEEERLTVAFVVENSSNGSLYQLFKVYINGILSGAAQYTSTALNFTNLNNGKIVLGSEECTLDIYSIRFYNRALSFSEIIKNWIANTGTYSEKIANFNKNNYSDSSGRITYTAFRQASPTTPYMVITGEGDWNNEDGLNAMPTTKAAGTFSTSDKQIKVVYTDPVNPANSFTTDFEGGEVGVAIQGTSSQEYKRKNYKIKLTNFMQNGVLHKKELTDADYNIVYEEINGTQQEVSRTLKTGIIGEGYKLSNTSLPTYTFCIKADVASSESANNTLLVGIYDSIVRQVALTPPQADQSNIRQGVEGYPMVVWYYNNKTKEYVFLGKYNFNNDKGTEDVYGFENGDESWEVGNNEKLLCFFDESEDPTWENWRTAFETRFPDDDKKMTKEKNAYTDEQIADRLAGLKQVVHWVSDSVSWVNADKEAVTFNNTPTADDTALSVSTGRSPELEAFRREFQQYFNLDLMLFFFVYTEFFLMVDNRAKNMFLTRYKVNASRPESATWHAANDSNVVTLNASTSTTDTYSGWFSLPYDMDTGVGTNNVGVYKFNYGYETGDYQPDGSVVFNGQKSKLWVAFTQAFGTEIKNMYITLANNLSYSSVESMFEQHQSVWSETVFNEDMIVKYIDWITTYDNENNPLTRDDRALPMLLGSKEEQRKWWLENRFTYFDSKYALNANVDAISLGVRKAQLNIPVTVYADAYVTFKVGAQDPAPTTIRVKVGETKTITRNTSNESGAGDRVESTLSPASRIRSVENLADLQLNNADFSRATRLQILRIGSATVPNERLTTINLSGNSLLHLFDLRNCTNYVNDLSLANCLSLENLYLAGTRMTNVVLPSGGILKTVQYPTTIQNITIINQPYLTNLIIGDSLPANEILTAEVGYVDEFDGTNDYSNINALYLNNAGAVDSLAIVEDMPSTGNLYLADINWTMTTEDFMTLFEKLNVMKGFVGTQPSDEVLSYLGGKLYLTTLPSDANIETIGARFGNLKLYYKDQQNNIHEYFSVKFYDPYNEAIKTQYVPGNGEATFDTATFFTEEYILAYNRYLNPSWTWGAATRQSFNSWDTTLTNVQSDLDVHPVMMTQYRMDYVLQTADPTIYTTEHSYFFEGDTIRNITTEPFERDYYAYIVSYWTEDGNQLADSIETGDERTRVVDRIKTATTQTWYAVYSRSPQIYQVKLYNTNSAGIKQGEPLITLDRAVVSGGISTTVVNSDISTYLPTNNNNVAMIGAESEIGVDDTNRTYRFLNVKPFIPNAGLRVTGNMDLLLTYYKTDDLFTNYFLNKLTNCNLGNTITSLPEGAFFHNTNLTKLISEVSNVGAFSFANANTNTRKIYIFNATNVNFDVFCFHSLQNAVVVFTGTGAIRINNYCFNNWQNCTILVLNSDLPITTVGDRNSGFTGIENNNIIYVTDEAYDKYPLSSNAASSYNIPVKLIQSERQYLAKLSLGGESLARIREEVGI